MPFRIDKVGNVYKIYNLEKKKYSKVNFKTKQSATNQKNNWLRYDKSKKNNR